MLQKKLQTIGHNTSHDSQLLPSCLCWSVNGTYCEPAIVNSL